MKHFVSSPQVALARILAYHGVRQAVVSPGSRDASLIEALELSGHFGITRVVDERTAGFVALGMALVSGEPVVLVCTSGSALLNYAPAVAEAFYREISLIVVSADRPAEWIDQNDSQTLRQPGALANIVKASYTISAGVSVDGPWATNRVLNDAMLTALAAVRGPVHINVHLPDCAAEGMDFNQSDDEVRMIDVLQSRRDITYNDAGSLARIVAATSRVMVVCTCRMPDNSLNKALNLLASRDNVVIVAERVANIQGRHLVYSPESVIASIEPSEQEAMAPELLITIGGAPISSRLKTFLRRHCPARHWNIGYTRAVTDCYESLTLRIEANPAMVVSRIAAIASKMPTRSDYFMKWNIAVARTESLTRAFASRAPWSDFKAMDFIASHIPSRWNVQLSNGTAIRYFEFLAKGRYHRVDCNRGVSGIDGSTSTAVGASLAYGDTTLLISGDMSAAYDLGGFALMGASPRMKMVVLCNGGGNIFRIIRATRSLSVCNPYLASMPELPLAALAAAYGLSYYEAADAAGLKAAWTEFVNDEKPALLAVVTDAEVSAATFADYFAFLKNK